MGKKADTPLVSIITLNYNGKRFLKDLLDSLRRCTYPNLEIILVDNCSTDDSVAFVQAHYPEVKVHQNAENYLYAGGNNEGLKIAAGEYLCLLNNDVTVDPGFVEPLVEMFRRYPRMAAGQPKILAMADPGQLEYAGACGGFLDWFGYPFLRGRIMDTTEADRGQYDQPLKIFWGSGACLFLRRDALRETGLLDADFGLHMEEIDLCWRFHLQGWEVLSIPQSRIWHFGGGTLNQTSPRKMYWNFRNNIFLLIKNLSGINLIIRLPLRVLLDAVALVVELLKGQVAGSGAILRAYGWVLTHLPLIFRHRREVQQKRTVSDRDVARCIYPGSVVFEYFLLQRKTFSRLGRIGKLLARAGLNPLPATPEVATKKAVDELMG
ncbi:MAG: glycosyltransferase family 2 protein [Calditrichaeota bacterium]|nr:glycosyltransferase family 2 protein [Calditrichota bacterium]